MTRTHWYLTAVVVALGAAAVEFTRDDLLSALTAGLAGAFAVGVAAFALTLPNIDWRGVVVGGFFVTAGMLSMTYTDAKIVVWGTLLVEGVLFLWWSRPWLQQLRESTRLGTAWLGVAYWVIGVIGAAAMLRGEVAIERLLYAGVFGLAVLTVIGGVRRDLRSFSTGVVTAFILAVALLFLLGSGNLFEARHVIPDNGFGASFEHRFWGGEWLLYHPNSLAGLGAMIAIRIGPDRAFTVWQRLSAMGLAGFVVYMTNSRAGFIFLTAGAGLHAILLWWRRRREIVDLPEYGGTRQTLAAAAAPFVVLALIFAVSGGTSGFLLQQRYSEGGVSSGRMDTWRAVGQEWRDGTVVEKLFGDTKTTRAVVVREGSGPLQLPTDNSAVGALRKAGILGVVAYLVGLGLLLWHARRKDAPAWFGILAFAAVPVIPLNDWLLGGTGGTWWILALSGEAALLYGLTRARDPQPELV